jgi:hypothetical protein
VNYLVNGVFTNGVGYLVNQGVSYTVASQLFGSLVN